MIDVPPLTPLRVHGDDEVVNSSKFLTPTGLNVSLYYQKIGVDDKWNGTDRIDRLCGFLKVTLYELADLIRVPHNDMGRWYRVKKYPSTVCLWFSLLEQCFMDSPDTEKELMPWSLVTDEQ
jgi:hypothetical protein